MTIDSGDMRITVECIYIVNLYFKHPKATEAELQSQAKATPIKTILQELKLKSKWTKAAPFSTVAAAAVLGLTEERLFEVLEDLGYIEDVTSSQVDTSDMVPEGHYTTERVAAVVSKISGEEHTTVDVFKFARNLGWFREDGSPTKKALDGGYVRLA